MVLGFPQAQNRGRCCVLGAGRSRHELWRGLRPARGRAERGEGGGLGTSSTHRAGAPTLGRSVCLYVTAHIFLSYSYICRITVQIWHIIPNKISLKKRRRAPPAFAAPATLPSAPTQSLRHSPTVKLYGEAISYERGTPVSDAPVPVYRGTSLIRNSPPPRTQQ